MSWVFAGQYGSLRPNVPSFLALDRSALIGAAPWIFPQYSDVAAGDDWYVETQGPHWLLDHVRLGDEPRVTRDMYGDWCAYLSLECESDWEPEHGLWIVFRTVVR